MRAARIALSVSALALLGLAACKLPEDVVAPAAAAQAAAPMPAAPAAKPVAQGEPNKKDATPAFAGQTRAPETPSGVKLNIETVASDLKEPWAIALLPDGALLVTERTGKLWRITPAGVKTEVTGAPAVDDRGQGGLLDISIGPDFSATRSVYFSFSEPRGNRTNATALARATLSQDGSKLEGVKVIFQQQPAWASTIHYGSNIEWDSTGSLYLALGERSLPEPRKLAQDLSTHIGKVVKLKADGTAADGNPFGGQANAKPEIWSYGHRNVQGAAIHPATGKLWTVEHGPRGGDEINVPQAGKNYGWPVVTYGIDYPGGPIGDGITSKEGLEQPVYYWDPVIAPGDMTFYKGNLFPWKGDLLVSGLAGYIVRLELDGEKVIGEERVMPNVGRIRDIQEAADGALWVITDDSAGKLLRVTPG